jgi:hypothetical protein
MCLRKPAVGRPSLPRVRALLDEVVANPRKANALSSLHELAQAAAQVSAKEQEAQAKQQAEIAAHNKRLSLAESAFQTLAENAERLCGKIQSHAANVNWSPDGARNAVQCQIGHGILGVALNRDNYVAPGVFPQSRWDVVAASRVVVMQEEPDCRWSASLWFAKIAGTTDYRWYEVMYYRLSPRGVCPIAEANFQEADLAYAPTEHSTGIAFGPIPIDDEEEEEFHGRWIWLLAKAAKGELRPPSRMPFGWPPPLSRSCLLLA